MATWKELTTSLEINMGTAFFFLLAFSIWRLQPQNGRVYFPKWYIKGVRKASVIDPSARKISLSKFVNLDYKAYVKLLSWIPAAFKMSEDELIDHAGLDSVVFLRIFLLGLKIFLPIAGAGFAILVPINMTDNNLVFEDQRYDGQLNITYGGIDKLSISNVKDKSNRLWAHLLMAYVFTMWICAVLYTEFRTVTNMRIRHLITRKRAPDQFTVLVRQVPPCSGKSIRAVVEDFFRLNHPDYLQTEVVYNANKLASILKKIETLENWLQYSEIKYDKNPRRIPTKRLGIWGLWGKRVDAIPYYTEEIEKLKQQAKVEHGIVLTDSKLAMPAGFVSFKSRWAAAVCAQSEQTRNTTKWITEWAPEPRDVYWKNLAIPYLSHTMRNVLMGGALILLVLFYIPFVTFVQSLANLEYIESHAKFLRPIVQNNQVRSILQGFVPGLVLKIILLVMPYVLMIMTKFEGHLSWSTLDKVAAAKMYVFNVVIVFFSSVITGSISTQLENIVKSKSVTNVLNILGDTIPMKATFFIEYILVDGWAGMAAEILRLIPLILYNIKNAVLVRTPRDRDRAMAPGNLLFNQNIPRLELYFLLGIVYCVMSPLITPFIIVAFAFGYLIFRNQVINVYEPGYDSAAAFWPHVHGRIIVAMIIAQLTLVGVFTIKGPIGFVKEDNSTGTRHEALSYIRLSLSSTPFMLLLPIGTLIFHWYCRRRFQPAFENYPLEDANAKDRQEKKDSPHLDLQMYLDKVYLNPALKEEEENIRREKFVVPPHKDNPIPRHGMEGGANQGNPSAEHDIEGGTDQGTPSPERDIEAGLHHALLKEEEREEVEEVEEPGGQIVGDSSQEFLDALSGRQSLQDDESPNSFYDSLSSSSSPSHRLQN